MKHIYFHKLGAYGRIGNQLFEIASTIGLAYRYNAEPRFPVNWKYREHFPDIPQEYFEDIECETEVIEDKFEYLPDFLESVKKLDSIAVTGTFQSQKYFYAIRDKIKEWLTPNGVLDMGEWSVGIHIRRGDYVNNPNYINYGPEYYLSAINKYFTNPHYKFYIVTDDMEYCKKHFTGIRRYFPNGDDITDLKILMGCHHHILCNSTFSWWGAYLSNSQKVIRPPKIFSGRLAETHKEDDFWPEEWTVHKDFKTNLNDVTFIIPVKYDHTDRRENLKITLDFLRKSFDTNIILGEQGGKFFKDTPGVKYVNFPYEEFHRTKMLNRMTELAFTPYVINWDADILLSPFQVIKMVEMLKGDYDFVYPYDGRFLRVGEGTYGRDPKLIEKAKSGDVGVFSGYKFVGENDKSVGGVIGYKKSVFIDAGMENENFIAYAPEDVERFERFTKLGFNVGRVEGALYHLNHFTGPDSSVKNPHWKEGVNELEKIRILHESSESDLIDYVQSWPWLKHKKIYFATYATEEYKKFQKRLTHSADITEQFDYIFTYNQDWLQRHDFYKENKKILTQKKGSGYWLWKPFIILETLKLMDEGDVLFYLDAGDVFKGDIRTFLLGIKQDILLTYGAHKNKEWTKRDCFINMGCDSEVYWNAIQLEAGIFVCRKSEYVIGIIKEWLYRCRDEECLTDIPSTHGRDLTGFKEHRHDQSILTNLKVKYNLSASDEMRQFVTCNVPIEKELKGITFLIPVFYDGLDRVKNLLSVIKYYKQFDIKIVLGEQLDSKFKYLDGQVDYIHFPNMVEFHRTKMLNEMAKRVSEDIIVVCDADVILPEDQLRKSIELLKENDVVYPYTSFVKLDRYISMQFRDNPNSIPTGVSMNSVGGMIFFKRESYLEAGGENEEFISWGVEDRELNIRFNKLGYKIARVEGNLYHLWHPKGVNSSKINPHYNHNLQVYDRVKNMDLNTLKEYVKILKK